MDPTASAEEKQMACYTAMFSIAEFGFTSAQVAAGLQALLAKHGGPGRVGGALGEAEHLAAHGPGKSVFFESRLGTGDLSGQTVEKRWAKIPDVLRNA
ncbi:MAG: hypothetical protein H7145_02615 [Akkermansiaceae bacterium]|nr:hypothetical protein [Armatimonadota bacterium]